MTDSQIIFNKIIEQKKSGLFPLAIFDLDSTLFEISFRTRKILSDISNIPEMLEKWPIECQALTQVEILSSDWGIRQAIIRSGLRASLDFFEFVRNHWRERFFSNQYLSYDRPYDGSVNYVKALKQAQIDIAYLSGRDQERMGLGTQESLKQWEFPFSENKTPGYLYLKPSLDISDSEFKNNFLKNIKHPHNQIWLFENEASIIEIVEKSCPEINIIFIDTIHSGKSSSPSHLPTILGEYFF